MRLQFCEAMVKHAAQPEVVFLTGDLGFMALEPLREAMGPRFINAGVSEQNMISVAAGLSKQGLDAWVYSIAPFVYARGFEQIRNDVAFHGLPVKVVGNGGGYGYGVMGPTHHAIEDYGIMLTLPNMKAFVPVFDQDIADVIPATMAHVGPAYLRLGRGETPKDYAVPAYAPWRQLTTGSGADAPVVVAVGPLAGSYIDVCVGRANLWAVAELPLSKNPMLQALLDQITQTQHLIVAEEHVAQGGLGAELALALIQHPDRPLRRGARMSHLFAIAHHFEGNGSQVFLRKQSRLDPQSLLDTLGAPANIQKKADT